MMPRQNSGHGPAAAWQHFCHVASAPKALELVGGHAGEVGGVLGVAAAEVILDQAQVVGNVGEVVATGVIPDPSDWNSFGMRAAVLAPFQTLPHRRYGEQVVIIGIWYNAACAAAPLAIELAWLRQRGDSSPIAGSAADHARRGISGQRVDPR